MGKTKTILLFLHLAGLMLTVAKAERVLKDHMKFENDAGKQKSERIFFCFQGHHRFFLHFESNVWQIPHLRN